MCAVLIYDQLDGRGLVPFKMLPFSKSNSEKKIKLHTTQSYIYLFIHTPLRNQTIFQQNKKD